MSPMSSENFMQMDIKEYNLGLNWYDYQITILMEISYPNFLTNLSLDYLMKLSMTFRNRA